MTDELVTRLRGDWFGYEVSLKAIDAMNEAADRIEQLTAERDVSNELGKALEEDAGQLRAERDRLRETLWEILACETPNANATVTRMASITKAALKGESHE